MRTTLKSYTAIPIEVCKHFKGKDLYLLAGLYINAPYERGAEYMITDTTFEQLAETTGVKVEYIIALFSLAERPSFRRIICMLLILNSFFNFSFASLLGMFFGKD